MRCVEVGSTSPDVHHGLANGSIIPKGNHRACPLHDDFFDRDNCQPLSAIQQVAMFSFQAVTNPAPVLIAVGFNRHARHDVRLVFVVGDERPQYGEQQDQRDEAPVAADITSRR